MESKLILNNIIELQDSYVIKSGNILWMYVYADISFGDLFNMLNDTGATETVRMYRYGTESFFEGFTELFYMRKEDDGFIVAGVRRPA